jgi:hypothetical protein
MVPAIAIDVTSTAAGSTLVAGRLLIVGVALMETTGVTGASCKLRDGSSAAGTRVIPFTLGPNESVRDAFPFGVIYEQGLFLDMAVGTAIIGSVFVVTESLLDPKHWARTIYNLTEGLENVG